MPHARANDVTRTGRRSLLRLGALGATGLVAGCSSPQRSPAVPHEREAEATVLGIPNERFFFGSPTRGMDALEREFEAAAARRVRHLGLRRFQDMARYDMLGVSGGGENGAFGAGLLCGWTEQGTRPTFELVTGVSTGALTAPFAFLGSDWDAPLKSVYTDITPAQVLESRGILGAVFNDAMADNAPLFETISRHLDERMRAAIAQAYQEGRLLLVASTNLDAQMPVIWNIGAIAASGHPGALDLVRRLLLASAAIPGAFPPVMIDVTVDGQPHQEMHVDGGAYAQVFLYPRQLGEARRQRAARGIRTVPASAYVIRNGRLDPEWASVDRRTLPIAGRAISTMIAASGLNDVVRIWNNTQRDGVDYNLAFIGRDFTGTYTEPFEQAYMRQLFDYGFQRARRGYDWTKQPPI
ncbi:patatin-like phospholipase family protein [Neoroseomonas soli]|uniref:Patatin family protein n=1 Tax=Neoroseomonas soli TaxID=1081025 RepID=A0A9X9WYI1_9PROT|nr:patatin-like phospholipase family protein [Neoroseomonas soli]MBR0672210.1 patatin family protein [Neoroseomonas soli]